MRLSHQIMWLNNIGCLGSVLTPLPFNTVIDMITKEMRKEAIWTVLYADDTLLYVESTEVASKMKEKGECWRKEASQL